MYSEKSGCTIGDDDDDGGKRAVVSGYPAFMYVYARDGRQDHLMEQDQMPRCCNSHLSAPRDASSSL